MLEDHLDRGSHDSCHRVGLAGACLPVGENADVVAVEERLNELFYVLKDLCCGILVGEDSVEFESFPTEN